MIPTREDLGGLYHDARLGLARYYLEKHNYHQALGHLRVLVELNPLSEEIYRLLMTAYAALEQRRAVRELYQALTAVLREELGLAPGLDTRRLYYRLMNERHDAKEITRQERGTPS
ncbi:MAG: AfsR/SARP family transcriptional regulator [Patescibacteria group bacterium]